MSRSDEFQQLALPGMEDDGLCHSCQAAKLAGPHPKTDHDRVWSGHPMEQEPTQTLVPEGGKMSKIGRAHV